MQIVVDHLTRMQPGYICVAGIDRQTNRHVRPTLQQRLKADLLARYGGPFEMAHQVDLGPTTYTGTPPEVEDYRFNHRHVIRLGALTAKEFWSLLQSIASKRLTDIFGPDLVQHGTSMMVDVGKGRASLGCLIPSSRPQLYLRSRPDRPDQIRLHVHDGNVEADLGVTDIRLYLSDHVTPDEPIVDKVADRLNRGEDVILSVGLTRPFASSPDFPPVHWLQVNNLHMASDPTWPLG